MKERFLDVVKWGLILVIAGAVFYLVYPKYYFTDGKGPHIPGFRCNKMTGQVEFITSVAPDELGKIYWVPVADR